MKKRVETRRAGRIRCAGHSTQRRLVVAICALGLGVAGSMTAQPAVADVVQFGCAGNEFSVWTVPAGVSELTINLVGAGGGAHRSSTGRGGKGANMTISTTVQPGDQLWAEVGCAGTRSTPYGLGRGGARGDSYWTFDGARGGGGTAVGFYESTRSGLVAAAGGGGGAGGSDSHGIGGGNGGNAGVALGGAPWAQPGTAGSGGGSGHGGAAACENSNNGGAGDSQGFFSSQGAGGGGGGGGYSAEGRGGGCGGGHGTSEGAAAGGGGAGASYVDTSQAVLSQIVSSNTGDGQVSFIYEIIP